MTGEELRRLREKLGWTQLQLAHELCVEEGTIYAKEKGTRRVTRRDIRMLKQLRVIDQRTDEG